MDEPQQGLAARLAAPFVSRFGSLLLVFGAVLLLLGGAMQFSRLQHLEAVESQSAVPDFEASLSEAASQPTAAAAAEPTASPTPAYPTRVEIPEVGIDAEVVEVGWEARIVNGEAQGNVWQTADYAAGLHRGSAGLGQVGNTVLSGHNNIAGAVFGELHQVEEGDLVYLSTEETRLPYRVEHKLVLWEEGASDERRRMNARWIQPTPDERVTLVSCYPPWGNTHRVIVVARPMQGQVLPGLDQGAVVR